MYDCKKDLPKKSTSRYSASRYRCHRNKDAGYDACVEGYVWLPPANFSDYLADDAHRLVIFREESFDGEWSIYDTRNMDAYTTSEIGFEAVAEAIYDIAEAEFRHALSRDLDMELTEAEIRYWSDQIVIKWKDFSVRFQKPETWELYNGFDRVASASSLDDLRTNPLAVNAISRRKGNSPALPLVVPGERPLPRNRVIAETLVGKRDEAFIEENCDFRPFDSFYGSNPVLMLHEYAWIAPRSLEDFEHGPAERLVVVKVATSQFEIYSPRRPGVIQATIVDRDEVVERLHLETFEGFRTSLEMDLGVDLRDAKIDCRGSVLTIQFTGPGLLIQFEDGDWEINGRYCGHLENVREHLQAEFLELLTESDRTSAPTF